MFNALRKSPKHHFLGKRICFIVIKLRFIVNSLTRISSIPIQAGKTYSDETKLPHVRFARNIEQSLSITSSSKISKIHLFFSIKEKP